MRISSLVVALLCVLVVGLTLPGFAQEEDNALPRVTGTTGKFVFNFTITASSAVPKNGVVVCNANASVGEAASGQSIFQKATGIATLSGGKWLCTATMPYSWALTTPTKDTVLLGYSVEIDYGLQVTATNGASVVVAPVAEDKVNQNIGNIAMPLNGATTTETVTATI